MMGDKLTFGNLDISFIVDEYLENYITIHNWLLGIGFPKNRTQFTDFRSTTANNQQLELEEILIGKVGKQQLIEAFIQMQLLQFFLIKIILL